MAIKADEEELEVPRPREDCGGGVRHQVSREVVCGTVQLIDFLAVVVASGIAYPIYFLGILGSADDFSRFLLTAALAGLIFVYLMRKTDGYRFERLAQLGWQIRRTAVLWAATVSTLTTFAFLTKVAEVYSRGWAITFVFLVLIELQISRIILRLFVRQWKAQGRLLRSVAVIGSGPAGEELIEKLKADGKNDVHIVGVFDDQLMPIPTFVGDCPVLGTTDYLVQFGQTSLLDEIIIALPLHAAERIGEIVAKLRLLPVDVRLSIDSIAGTFPMRGIGSTSSVPVIEILDRPLKHWSGVNKWLEDKILSALCILALAPFMALIALAIRLDSRGPIFFSQERFGFNNRPIWIVKFRTMHAEKGDLSGAVRTVPNDSRVTRVGRILRALSLDELPQLFNVLRGDMSLVGPRAHALAMKAGDRLYHEAVGEYLQRHRVRPGITGWAQTHGSRGEINGLESAKQRVALDLYYIDNWSLWLDITILIRTLWVVLRRENAY